MAGVHNRLARDFQIVAQQLSEQLGGSRGFKQHRAIVSLARRSLAQRRHMIGHLGHLPAQLSFCRKSGGVEGFDYQGVANLRPVRRQAARQDADVREIFRRSQHATL